MLIGYSSEYTWECSGNMVGSMYVMGHDWFHSPNVTGCKHVLTINQLRCAPDSIFMHGSIIDMIEDKQQ